MVEQKHKANAVSAYFLLAGLFLLPGKNKDIKNDFVQKHSKSAFFIHILFLITYLIFIYFDFLNEFFFLEKALNDIIAWIIFTILFWILVYWASKANSGKEFKALDFIKSKNYKQILSWEKTNEISELNKIKFALSYVPLLGIIINNNSKEGPNYIASKFSSLMWLIFIFFIYLDKWNSLEILSLIYTIFIVFTGIFILVKDEFILIDFNLPNAKEFVNLLTTSLKYVKNIFTPSSFQNFKDLIISVAKSEKLKDLHYEKEAKGAMEFPLPKQIIHIPFLNIITIWFIKSDYKNHIIAWLITTIFTLIILLTEINNSLILVLLFPITYAFLNIKNPSYRTPFTYNTYEFFKYFLQNILRVKNDVDERYNTEKNLNLKVDKKD